jgi:hypothetical protein
MQRQLVPDAWVITIQEQEPQNFRLTMLKTTYMASVQDNMVLLRPRRLRLVLIISSLP